MNVQPFGPGASAALAATAASGSVAIPTVTASSLYIANSGPNKAFVRMTTGASAALVTDVMIPPNVAVIFTKPPLADTFSAICAATETATLSIASGEGH